MGDISGDCKAEFIDEYEFESFEDLYLDIENTQINAKWENRKDFRLNKVITFVYSTIMDFPDNKFEIKTCHQRFFQQCQRFNLRRLERTSFTRYRRSN